MVKLGAHSLTTNIGYTHPERILYSGVALIGTLLALIVCISSALSQPSPDALPGVLIVKYKEGHAKRSLPLNLEVHSVEPAFPSLENLRKRVPSSVTALQRIHRVRYGATISPQEAARLVSALSSVEYAEPLYPRVPYGEQINLNTQRPTIPNDPLYFDSSYLDRLHFPEAWDVVKGEDAEVTIAIIDSGTDWRHDDLYANVWTNLGEIPNNRIDDDRNGYVDDVHGWNFTRSTNDPSPNTALEYHGSYVTGVSNAVSDNRIGMAGASWNAKFIPINTNCDGRFTLCFTDQGVVYAAMLGADIINGSYGSSFYSNSEHDAIKAATDLGSLVVVAAGNEKSGQEYFRHFPGGLQEALTVCGTTPDSDENVFNYGFSVDVCAPGIGVLTTVADGGYFDNAQGTSFAAPIVSGLAALVKTKFPDISAIQLREQIRATSNNIDFANHPSLAGRLGRGRVNAYGAVTETDAVSIRLTEWILTDENQDGRYDPLEHISVEATFVSYLSDVEAVTILWGVHEDEVILTSGQFVDVGLVKSGESFTTRLRLTSTANVPYRSRVFIEPIVLNSKNEVLSGGDAIPMIINDVTIVQIHDQSNTVLNVTSEGNLGWVDFSWISNTDYLGEVGSGVIFSDVGVQIEDEAGLIVGHQSQVASSVFETHEDSPQNQDFVPLTPLSSWECGQRLNCTSVELFAEKINVEVVQKTLSNPLLDKVALIRYLFRSPTNQSLTELYAGIYATFSFLDDFEFQHVIVEEEQTILTQNPRGSQHIGVGAISDQYDNLHIRAVAEAEFPNSDDAWEMMKGGIVGTDLPTVGQYIGLGPLSIPPNMQDSLTFSIVYGDDYEDVLANLRFAKSLAASWIGNEFSELSVGPTLIPSLAEGSSVDIAVKLLDRPVSSTTVVLTAGSDHIGFSGSSLSDSNTLEFTTDNWNQDQTVTVEALNDSQDIGDKWRRVFISASGYSGKIVQIFVLDDDAVELDIEPNQILNLVEGMTADFAVRLTANPRANVIAFLSQDDFNHDIKLTLSTQSLVFTPDNWDQDQTVIVTAEDNDTNDGDAWQYVYITLFGEQSQVNIQVLDDEARDVANEKVTSLPTVFSVIGNYPNPFQTSTEILFDLPLPSKVSVSVIDMLGRKIREFPPADYHAGWSHTIKIDLQDMAAGIYMYQVIATSEQSTQSSSALMSLVH